MLNQILSSLKGEALGKLNDNQDIPNEKIDDILHIAGEETEKEIAREAGTSGLQNIMNLFSDSENTPGANSIQNKISQNIISKLTGSKGLNPSAAETAVSTVLPMILNKITAKNNETPSDDPSPLSSVFGMLNNNNSSGGLLRKIGGFFK